jgi:hypothetical protein
MKSRLAVTCGVGLGLVAMASLCFAGDFHYGINLICSDCHVMHYSQSHGYNAKSSCQEVCKQHQAATPLDLLTSRPSSNSTPL